MQGRPGAALFILPFGRRGVAVQPVGVAEAGHGVGDFPGEGVMACQSPPRRDSRKPWPAGSSTFIADSNSLV